MVCLERGICNAGTWVTTLDLAVQSYRDDAEKRTAQAGKDTAGSLRI